MINLIYLSKPNLQDRLFVKDLVHNYKRKEKSLLLHEGFGDTIPDTSFVTKRLSSLFSEAMVYNRAFQAHQRNLISQTEGRLHFKTEEIMALLEHIQLLIIGPVIKQDGSLQLADSFELLRAARGAFDTHETILFTDNPLSPLATKRLKIDQETDLDPLLKAYEEESPALERTLSVSPAHLASPLNYML